MRQNLSTHEAVRMGLRQEANGGIPSLHIPNSAERLTADNSESDNLAARRKCAIYVDYPHPIPGRCLRKKDHLMRMNRRQFATSTTRQILEVPEFSHAR